MARPGTRNVRHAFDRRSLIVGIALVLATLVVPHAGAQHDEEPDARALFQRGAEAYTAERYPEALEAFDASYRAREAPVVLFNRAQTLRALERPAEAIEACRRYLATDAELDEARRAAVDAVIAELTPQVSLVRLEVFPHRAEVRVDGRSLGRAPFEARVAIDPGERRLEVSAEGHVALTRELRLSVSVSVSVARSALQVGVARHSDLRIRDRIRASLNPR